MVNTKILLSVVIVLLIGVAAATYHVTTTTPGLWQPTTSQGDQKSTDQGTSTQSDVSQQSGTQTGSQSGTQTGTSSQVSQSGTGVSGVKITEAEAKVVAQKHNGQPGTTLGNPTLKKIDGKPTYIFPVNQNGKQVGEIDIDAQTGKCVGVAGGAPTNG